jgi:hypothetical protein
VPAVATDIRKTIARARRELAQGMACAYCGRADQPDVNGHCNGCGAPHARSQKVDVTTLSSPEREFVWVPA